jgi:hypothetical protein
MYIRADSLLLASGHATDWYQLTSKGKTKQQAQLYQLSSQPEAKTQKQELLDSITTEVAINVRLSRSDHVEAWI